MKSRIGLSTILSMLLIMSLLFSAVPASAGDGAPGEPGGVSEESGVEDDEASSDAPDGEDDGAVGSDRDGTLEGEEAVEDDAGEGEPVDEADEGLVGTDPELVGEDEEPLVGAFEEEELETESDALEEVSALSPGDVWVYIKDPVSGLYSDTDLTIPLKADPYYLKDYIVTQPAVTDFDNTFDIIFAPVSDKVAELNEAGELITKAVGLVKVQAVLVGKEGGDYEGGYYFLSVVIKTVTGLQAVTLNQQNEKKLAVGKAFTPKIAYTPSNVSVKNAAWSISAVGADAGKIVSVNEHTGKVTALSPGRVSVELSTTPFALGDISEGTAVSGGAIVTGYDVFVPAKEIEINLDEEKVNGQTLRLVPPDDDRANWDFYTSLGLSATAVSATFEAVSWSSNEQKKKPENRIVELIDNGDGTATVNAQKTGTATLTAKAEGGKTATVKIKVAKSKAMEIFCPDFEGKIIQYVDDDYRYLPKQYYETTLMLAGDGYEEPIKWSASKKGAVYILPDDFDGTEAEIWGLKAGSVTITAKDRRGKTAKINVTVRYPVTEVNITKPKNDYVSLPKGKSYTVKAKVNKKASIKGLEWSSSDPTVATVSPNGKVKAVSEGWATISARSKDNPGAVAGCDAYVKVNIKKVLIAQSKVTIPEGAWATLNAVTVPPGYESNCEFLWLPNNSALGFEQSYIDFLDYVFEYEDFDTGWGDSINVYGMALPKGKNSRTAKMTVYELNYWKKAGVTITVKKNGQLVRDFRLSKNAAWLMRGKSETMKPVFNEGIDPVTNKKWTAPANKQVYYELTANTFDGYSTDASTIAKIDRNGKVTAVGHGIAYITAYSSENPAVFYDSCVVYCSPKP